MVFHHQHRLCGPDDAGAFFKGVHFRANIQVPHNHPQRRHVGLHEVGQLHQWYIILATGFNGQG